MNELKYLPDDEQEKLRRDFGKAAEHIAWVWDYLPIGRQAEFANTFRRAIAAAKAEERERIAQEIDDFAAGDDHHVAPDPDYWVALNLAADIARSAS